MVRERIIKESYLLFVRHGVKTTMDEIAKHLGISKRTIYENFKDKNELLAKCTEYMSEQANVQVTEIFEKADNVLEAGLQLLYRQNVKGKHNLKYMMELGRYYPEIYRDHMLKYQEGKQKGIEELMRKGIEEGVFRADINPLLTAFMFSEQANLIFSEQFQKFNADIGSSIDDFLEISIFENMVVTYIRGISTPKGIQILDDYLKRYSRNR
ncbi:MAG: TetR/AcrR family transcriptional regulator [Prevotellaceae bacterium]|jgi:AcrR family transcriptional regulator|nr:TetR/AcrR family transcriptional regulator [Prevotellaceae bacterium]